MNRRFSRHTISLSAFVLLGSVMIAPVAGKSVDGVWALLVIDCQHSSIGSEGTDDLITVEFYSDGTFIGSRTQIPRCSVDDIYGTETVGDKAKEIDEIQVRAHGDNALYIDRAWYRTATQYAAQTGVGFYKTRYTWGAQDGQGYCVSTDPDDGRTDWSGYVFPEDKCYSCLRFIMKDDGDNWINGCNKNP